MTFAMLLLSALAATPPPAAEAAPIQAVILALPAGVPKDRLAISLMCRDARSRWITVIGWQQAGRPPFAIVGPAGRRCRAMVRPFGAATYLTSGEMAWGLSSQPVTVSPNWQRTIHAPPSTGEVLWLGASGTDGAECETSAEGSRCLFVPVDAPGVLASPAAGGLVFSVVPRGPAPAIAAWKLAAWGRVVRVHAPGRGVVDARAIVLQPSLRRGSGQMHEARPAPGIALFRLGPHAFWVASGTAPRGELELRSVGAATTRLPLASIAASFPSATDIALPAGESITGEVRSRGLLIEGVTVMLTRLLERPAPAPTQDDPPIERVGEAVTDPSGHFTFVALARGRYELLAVDSSRGRARQAAAPTTHVRLELRPRALVRGRVVQQGVPVPSALVQLLPSLEAVTSARNPLALGAAPVPSGPDGRFAVIAPDEGRVMLSVNAGSGAVRMDLGDAAVLPETLDVGDITLQAPLELEIVAELPAGCELHAAGPLGATGLSVIRAVALAPARWRVTPPLPGRWLFAAVCAGQELALDPPVVEVPPARPGDILLTVRR